MLEFKGQEVLLHLEEERNLNIEKNSQQTLDRQLVQDSAFCLSDTLFTTLAFSTCNYSQTYSGQISKEKIE